MKAIETSAAQVLERCIQKLDGLIEQMLRDYAKELETIAGYLEPEDRAELVEDYAAHLAVDRSRLIRDLKQQALDWCGHGATRN